MELITNTNTFYRILKEFPWTADNKTFIEDVLLYTHKLFKKDKQCKIFPINQLIEIKFIERFQEQFIALQSLTITQNSIVPIMYFQINNNTLIQAPIVTQGAHHELVAKVTVFSTDSNDFLQICELLDEYVYKEKVPLGFK